MGQIMSSIENKLYYWLISYLFQPQQRLLHVKKIDLFEDLRCKYHYFSNIMFLEAKFNLALVK